MGHPLPRDVHINLRARVAQRELIDQAAQASGRNRSDFMLEAAVEKAQAVLLDRTFFTFNPAAFEQFITLLEAPYTPHPGVVDLLSRVEPWEKS